MVGEFAEADFRIAKETGDVPAGGVGFAVAVGNTDTDVLSDFEFDAGEALPGEDEVTGGAVEVEIGGAEVIGQEDLEATAGAGADEGDETGFIAVLGDDVQEQRGLVESGIAAVADVTEPVDVVDVEAGFEFGGEPAVDVVADADIGGQAGLEAEGFIVGDAEEVVQGAVFDEGATDAAADVGSGVALFRFGRGEGLGAEQATGQREEGEEGGGKGAAFHGVWDWVG